MVSKTILLVFEINFITLQNKSHTLFTTADMKTF